MVYKNLSNPCSRNNLPTLLLLSPDQGRERTYFYQENYAYFNYHNAKINNLQTIKCIHKPRFINTTIKHMNIWNWIIYTLLLFILVHKISYYKCFPWPWWQGSESLSNPTLYTPYKMMCNFNSAKTLYIILCNLSTPNIAIDLISG